VQSDVFQQITLTIGAFSFVPCARACSQVAMAAASSGIIIVGISSTRGAGPEAAARRARGDERRRGEPPRERDQRESRARSAEGRAQRKEAPRSGEAPAGEAASLVTPQSRRAPPCHV